jgi:S-adenosylmethionine:tRNA ribosyltransferase-isomerase
LIAASVPVQRPADARLLAVDPRGRLIHMARSEFVRLLRPGDLVVANDAATLPAILVGQHLRSGRRIEVRLAGRDTLSLEKVGAFRAVLFGLGDFRMRTEDRPLPPDVRPGDRLALGPLRATVTRVLYASRLVELGFEGTPDEIWAGLVRHGRPIQYSHVPTRLAIWDTWTPFAGAPVAFEPPSAGFALDWRTIAAMTGAGIRFATITHAAGISSTGDATLDAMLPLDEPYRIPETTARAITLARARRGRLVAIGTTAVRALEHAADDDGNVAAGEGVATGRIDGSVRLRVLDALLSGTHERGSSHYELLRAFTDDATLARIDRELELNGYRTHEFGDSVFIERRAA